MSGTVTGLDLDRLEELAKQATPGPWGVGNGDTIATNVEQTSRGSFRFGQIIARLDDTDYLEANEDADDVEDQMSDDADLIAALRNAVPSLLAAARAVQRVEALIAPVARMTAHEALETSSPAYFLAMSQFADQVRAALGTEQEGRN